MKIEQFEKELRETVSPDFTILVAPNNPDMAGVYWKGLHVCSIPSGEIFDEVRSDYRNSHGMLHRTRPTTIGTCKKYLWRIQNEPGFYEDEMSYVNGE